MNLNKNEITRDKFLENQFQYCKDKDIPGFIPWDGKCFFCHSDIAQIYIDNGYKGDDLYITGCPVCHRTFCG